MPIIDSTNALLIQKDVFLPGGLKQTSFLQFH